MCVLAVQCVLLLCISWWLLIVVSVLLFAAAPTHLESLIKFANFEKRQGDLSKAIELYTKAVEVSTDAQRPYVAAHAAQCAAQVALHSLYPCFRIPAHSVSFDTLTWVFSSPSPFVVGWHRRTKLTRVANSWRWLRNRGQSP